MFKIKLYKKLILIILLGLPFLSISQSIDHFSINSASGFYSQNLNLDFSFGQTIVLPFENNNIITSGFQQPIFKTNKKKFINNKFSKFNIKCFPNPVVDIAYISITSEIKINQISIKLFSIDGKEISLTQKINNYDNFLKIELNFSSLKQGNYILKTCINQTFTNNFKIIKL